MTIYESLVQRALEIRNAILVGENTAERVGGLLRDMLDYTKSFIDESRESYLSATDDDVAQGLIKFLKGAEYGRYATGVSGAAVDENGDAEFRNVKVRQKFGVKELTIGDYEEGVDGAHIDEHGNTELATLLTRGIATLAGLIVKGDAEFDGSLSSRDFVSGFLSGTGWAIQKKTFINAADVEETRYAAEFDDLTIRGTLRVFEMIISQLLGENDNRVFTGMMEVDHYDQESGKVYLSTANGKLYNPFRVGDYIEVQQFNGLPSEGNDYTVVKSYELRISGAGVGSLSDEEDRLDWVTFENFVSVSGSTAESLISKGDTFVRVDSTDPDRKGIVEVMTVGPNTPYIDVMYGKKTDPDNALKGRTGNLEGIHHHLFGWLKGFGEYLINLYAVGDFRLRRTGESLDAKIEALRNILSTNYTQTVYDITEEDNYLKNANFLSLDEYGKFEHWVVADDDMSFYTLAGLPLFENTGLMAKATKVARLFEVDGKKVLHVVNNTLTQANADVRKPGTHKVYTEPSQSATEEYTTEKDTLYLNIKVKVLSSGRLTLGFPAAESVSGSLPKVALDLEKDDEWQLLQWKGTWDGTGDFKLGFTGEAYFSLLSLTDEPLSDFKKEYSTQITQTAKNITLLAQRVSGSETNIAQLQITADGLLSTVRTLEDGIETNSSLIEQQSSRITAAVSRISDNESAISQLEIRADGIVSSVTLLRQDMNGADQALSSRISQNADSITAAVSRISDNESAISQLRITASDITEMVTQNKADADREIAARRQELLNYMATNDPLVAASASWINANSNWVDIVSRNWDSSGNILNSSSIAVLADRIKSEVQGYTDGKLTNYSTVTQTNDAITTAVRDLATAASVSDLDGRITSDLSSIRGSISNLDEKIDDESDENDRRASALAGWQQSVAGRFTSIEGKWDSDGNLIGYSRTDQFPDLLDMYIGDYGYQTYGDVTNRLTSYYNKTETDNKVTMVLGRVISSNLLTGLKNGSGWSYDEFYDSSCTFVSEDYYIYSPTLNLPAGTYTVSAGALSPDAGRFITFNVKNAETGSLIYSGSLDCGNFEPERSSVTFTLSSPAKVYLSFDANYCRANFQLIKPKLECGENATPWSVESDVVDSRIEMSREAITLQLRNSGINLTNKSIELLAGKVSFGYYDNGTKKTDKVWIDSANGTLHAKDGDFEGKITATQGDIGGFTIGSSYIGNAEMISGVWKGLQLYKDGRLFLGNDDYAYALRGSGGLEWVGNGNDIVLNAATGSVSNHGNIILVGYLKLSSLPTSSSGLSSGEVYRDGNTLKIV